ncbi:MAG TPA: trypsin-like peptidase domain-containing protein, partial [Chthoniobacterales bacterium]|nr:trypsin-like peptidase domain-containing protein [Chthoniobacterales bacterium]
MNLKILVASRLLFAILLLPAALIASTPDDAPKVPELAGINTPGFASVNNRAVVLPSERYGLSIDLPSVTHDLGQITVPVDAPARPLRIGVARAVEISPVANASRFRNADGTQVIVSAIRSPGAQALRLHFVGFEIAAGDEVYVLSGTDNAVRDGPYRARGLWNDGDFWSATIEGDTAVIEYHVKGEPGTFSISEVSHIYRDAGSDLAAPDVLACEIDASCSSEGPKSAVGRIIFVSGGDSYVCTGTLLNNSNGDRTPYFLTASHCVGTQSEAQTVEAYWLYQTTSCNSNTLRGDWARTTGGADLLATRRAEDSSLIRFVASVPPSVTFAGWTAAPQNFNTTVLALHHPGGSSPPSVQSYLRRSVGRISATSASCSASGLSVGYTVDWTSGTTEGGSSGSGIFINDGNVSYVVGVLSCGPAADTCSDSYDDYGKFSSFYPLVQQYLNPAPPPSTTRLGNLSTRVRVETGNNVMIGGFIVPGTQPKRVALRALGPSLAAHNIAGAMADPVLELNNASGPVAAND